MNTSLFVSSSVRASIVLATGLLSCGVLARASAATRRAVLALALGGSLVVPLVATVVPSWHVEAPAALGVFVHETSLEGMAVPGGASATNAAPLPASPVAASAHRYDAASVVLALWAGGAALLFARSVLSLRRARALVQRSTPLPREAWGSVLSRAARAAGAAADVRISRDVESPAVTGLFRSTVLLPADADAWSGERKLVVLVHELAHVRRRDGLVQLVANVACAASWFSPLSWLCARRLRLERELAADDAVLASGVRPSSYAEELLALAGGRAHGALAMAERSSLESRVIAILAEERARGVLATRGKTLLVAASLVMGVALACTSPEMPVLPEHQQSLSPLTGASIDTRMQLAAEQEVTTLFKDATGESAVVVVLDPSTGQILANAGRRGEEPFDVARSQAMSPGSTLKTIMLAAAIETSSIKPGQLFNCGPGPRKYSDGELQDSSAHGTLDAAHILAVSSNIGMSYVFDAVGGDRLGDWLARFRFGRALPLDGAASGLVPAAIATGTLSGAMIATGQRMTATPLQIAAAYGALANDGVYHAPTFDRDASPAERLVSSATAQQIMSMLDLVVSDETGTGKWARVEGLHVAGKTGTAGWTSPDGHEHVYASFVGVADLPARRVVALVGVETLRQDVHGPTTAGPAFARLVSRLR